MTTVDRCDWKPSAARRAHVCPHCDGLIPAGVVRSRFAADEFRRSAHIICEEIAHRIWWRDGGDFTMLKNLPDRPLVRAALQAGRCYGLLR